MTIRNLFKIIIPIFLLSFSFSERQIKKTTEYKYSISQKFGQPIENLRKKIIKKYDSNNNKIELSTYNLDGSLENYDIYKYDSNNNISEVLEYDIENKFGSTQEILTEKSIITYEYYD